MALGNLNSGTTQAQSLRNSPSRLTQEPHEVPYALIPPAVSVQVLPIAACEPVVRDGFVSVQVNVDHRGFNKVGDAANEPSIAIDPTDPRKMVIGWRQFDTIESDFRQAGYAYSHDAGHTWVFTGALTPGVFGSDPVLAAGPDGEIYYLSINRDEMRLFKSINGGVSWSDPKQIAPFLVDKPWMTTDRTDGVGRGNVYISAGILHMVRSSDGGQTFTDSIEIQPPGFPTLNVGPEGRVYVTGLGGGILSLENFMRSSNAQNSSEPLVIDLMTTVEIGIPFSSISGSNGGGLNGQIWVESDHSNSATRGNVYLLSSSFLLEPFEIDVLFVRSTDHGKTWTDPLLINDDPQGLGAWHWFGTMSVAPNGRIDIIWNDTRNFLDAPNARLSEMYYSFSTDGGLTFAANIPVTPVFDSYLGFPQNLKLGDYYHSISDNLGMNVAFAATFNGEQDIFFLRLGPWDCNGNQIPDEQDISTGNSLDCNARALNSQV